MMVDGRDCRNGRERERVREGEREGCMSKCMSVFWCPR